MTTLRALTMALAALILGLSLVPSEASQCNTFGCEMRTDGDKPCCGDNKMKGQDLGCDYCKATSSGIKRGFTCEHSVTTDVHPTKCANPSAAECKCSGDFCNHGDLTGQCAALTTPSQAAQPPQTPAAKIDGDPVPDQVGNYVGCGAARWLAAGVLVAAAALLARLGL